MSAVEVPVLVDAGLRVRGLRPQDLAGGQHYSWAIELDGRFAGTVGLTRSGPGAARVDYGSAGWARGRGVTARALRLVVPWAFDALDLEVVQWQAIAGNWASRKVAWSLGFHLTGPVAGLVEQRGERRDGWIGALRRGDPMRPAHPWFDPPVLRSDVAVLRPHRDADDVPMAQACADPVTQRWLPMMPTPYTVQDAREHLAGIAEDQARGRAMYWAVSAADDPDRHLLGEVGLQVQQRDRDGELGYWAHPEARGRGLITAAVRLAARHALLPAEDGGLGLTRVVLRAAEGNDASRAVAERVGFRHVGVDREADLLRDGSRRDLHRFDLLPRECP